jgi:hypothetical protein
MYLSAERIAVANQAVKETFEQTSIAWQAIPHWDTGDPAQTKVRCDSAYAPPDDPGPLGEDPVPILTFSRSFYLTVAQATAPTPDALLAAVIARTVYLAGDVDGKVIGELLKKSQPHPHDIAADAPPAKLLNGLIDARATLEDAGYRAPCCLLTDTVGLKAISQLDLGYPILQPLLDAANVNSRYRVDKLENPGEDQGVDKPEKPGEDQGVDKPEKPGEDQGVDKPEKPGEDQGVDKPEKPGKDQGVDKPDDEDGGEPFDVGAEGTKKPDEKGRMLLLGRRQRIAHGGAAAASPGEEPVDLAISAPPSLEVIGETRDGYIEFAVRIRFAPRITDRHGVVGVVIS